MLFNTFESLRRFCAAAAGVDEGGSRLPPGEPAPKALEGSWLPLPENHG